MPKRSKIILLLIMPVAILLWIIGWSLNYLASPEKTPKIKTPKQLDDLSLIVLMPEEKHAQQY